MLVLSSHFSANFEPASICPHKSRTLLPCLLVSYKALPPSVWSRPKFRARVRWSFTKSFPLGKKSSHKSKVFYLFITFHISFFFSQWITWSKRIFGKKEKNGYRVFIESYGDLRWTGKLGAYQTDSASDRQPEPRPQGLRGEIDTAFWLCFLLFGSRLLRLWSLIIRPPLSAATHTVFVY